MSPYTISVQDQCGDNTTYAVIMEPPQFTGGAQSWMNVWYTSFAPIYNSFDITIESDYYACTFGLRIYQSFPIIDEISPSAVPGAYEIQTGTDFHEPNNTYLVGLAQVNNGGQPAPIASIAPRSNEQIQITPKMKFFVAKGDYRAGEIVDYATISRDGAIIDFSSGPGLGNSFARVIQSSDGKFTASFYDSPESFE